MNIPVTEWFSGHIPPALPGYYQRQYPCIETDKDYQIPDYFDGNNWFIVDVSGGKCRTDHKMPWRGLTSPHPEWKP